MSSTRSVKSLGVYGSAAAIGVPPTPIAGASYRDATLLAAELAAGWKYGTMVNSASFNEWLFRMSSLVDIMDKQGVLGWCSGVDYVVPAMAFGSDGLPYLATSASGPSGVGAKDPTSTAGYWKPILLDSRVGEITLSMGTTLLSGTVKANGGLLNRIGIYADLWAWANASGNIVSDATWTSSSGYRGCYSTGDGATTFRVPNIRGTFPRFFHDGDTTDPDYATRLIGYLQGTMNLSHSHRMPYDIMHDEGPSGTSISGGANFAVNNNWYTNADGGPESRPINIPFMGAIKYR